MTFIDFKANKHFYYKILASIKVHCHYSVSVRSPRMLFLVACTCVLISVCTGSRYVPGTPGSPWTKEELFATRGQLTAIFRDPRNALFKVPAGPVSFLEGKVSNWQTITGREIFNRYKREIDANPAGIKEDSRLEDVLLPNIPKFVRLAFHDCVRDTETGGCNGCLNFRNMGAEGKGSKSQGCHKNQSCPKDSLAREIDNNNLLWLARVLEILYTNARPPFSRGRKFQFKISLRDSGKSRADLWAFAGIVAMETASQINNYLCRGGGTGLCPGQFDERSPPCKYTLPTLSFKSGRRDCISSCTGADAFYGFCSTAEESLPDPLGNGESVTTFFKDTFNFTRKESVAILGVHTLGHAHEQISGFRHYPWTNSFKEVLNNNYYKQMANPGMYRIRKRPRISQKCDLKLSTFIGDEYGNPIPSTWVPRSQFQNNDGGPWNWNPFGRDCDPRICQQISESEMVGFIFFQFSNTFILTYIKFIFNV